MIPYISSLGLPIILLEMAKKKHDLTVCLEWCLSFQNMMWTFLKRLILDKISVSSNKLTSPMQILHAVHV